MATSQNGWPASADRNAIGVDANFSAAGVKFPGGVKGGDVATVLGHVATQIHNRVEALVAGTCWGYAYRAVRGATTGLSNHASGTAIDINAPQHPLGATGTFSVSQVMTIRSILNECGGVVRWGGDYSGRKDAMHFEINGTAGSVAVIAARLRGGTAPPAPQPPSGGHPQIQQGSKGDAVRLLQQTLKTRYPLYAKNLTVDGDFGPKTKAAVVEFQRRSGLTADGIVGPKTWAALQV
jgi:Putative peptidoglycan binding domain/D-alanyl-D-alanine carboxypeptidase